jgi:hypothetical protein
MSVFIYSKDEAQKIAVRVGRDLANLQAATAVRHVPHYHPERVAAAERLLQEYGAFLQDVELNSDGVTRYQVEWHTNPSRLFITSHRLSVVVEVRESGSFLVSGTHGHSKWRVIEGLVFNFETKRYEGEKGTPPLAVLMREVGKHLKKQMRDLLARKLPPDHPPSISAKPNPFRRTKVVEGSAASRPT